MIHREEYRELRRAKRFAYAAWEANADAALLHDAFRTRETEIAADAADKAAFYATVYLNRAKRTYFRQNLFCKMRNKTAPPTV